MLRAADPLVDEPQRTAAATDAALVRLMSRVPSAAADPLGESRPRRTAARRRAARLTPVVAAAATAVVVVTALPSGGPVTVPAASAKVILAKAAAAVAGSDGAILHADISAVQTWQDGGTEQWTEQEWQQVGSPYNERSIDSGIWPTPVETAYVNGAMWLYDAGTDAIYTNDPPPPFTLTPGPQTGTYILRPAGQSNPSLTVDAGQAAALRAGTDVWASDAGGGLVVVPRPTTGPRGLSDFRPEALALLNSPSAKVTRDVTIDGQDALEVSSADGATVYYLNPTTYAPIQMTRPIANTGRPGDTATVTLTFTSWQDLTGSSADPSLLSLTAQHPNAAVDDSASDYTAAAARLFR
jgi:hypothetical protein